MPTGKPNTIDNVLDRLFLYDGDCLMWTGCKNSRGYGMVKFQGKGIAVHHLLYRHFVGPVPEGMELDHLCRNRACANVEHLEAVSHQVNCQRGLVGESGAVVFQSSKT